MLLTAGQIRGGPPFFPGAACLFAGPIDRSCLMQVGKSAQAWVGAFSVCHSFFSTGLGRLIWSLYGHDNYYCRHHTRSPRRPSAADQSAILLRVSLVIAENAQGYACDRFLESSTDQSALHVLPRLPQVGVELLRMGREPQATPRRKGPPTHIRPAAGFFSAMHAAGMFHRLLMLPSRSKSDGKENTAPLTCRRLLDLQKDCLDGLIRQIPGSIPCRRGRAQTPGTASPWRSPRSENNKTEPRVSNGLRTDVHSIRSRGVHSVFQMQPLILRFLKVNCTLGAQCREKVPARTADCTWHSSGAGPVRTLRHQQKKPAAARGRGRVEQLALLAQSARLNASLDQCPLGIPVPLATSAPPIRLQPAATPTSPCASLQPIPPSTHGPHPPIATGSACPVPQLPHPLTPWGVLSRTRLQLARPSGS